MPACTKRGRAKESNNSAVRAVLELCHAILPVSLVASRGAVIPLGKTQHFWCQGQGKEEKVSGGMRPAGQGRPVSPGLLRKEAATVLKFGCSGLKGFVLAKIFLKENCCLKIVEISTMSECIPGQVTKSVRRFANRRNSRW